MHFEQILFCMINSFLPFPELITNNRELDLFRFSDLNFDSIRAIAKFHVKTAIAETEALIPQAAIQRLFFRDEIVMYSF